MFSALFSGLTTKAAIASGLIGALVVGAPAVLVAHNAGYGKRGKEAMLELQQAGRREQIAVTREIALWTELAASRSMQVQLVSNTEIYWDATDEAREKMRRELAAHKARAQKAVMEADNAIRRLSEIQHAWKGVEVPRVVLEPFCVRDGQDKCDPAAPARSAAGDGVAVREPAAGDGARVD